jgi:hypothetical protein
MYDTGCNRLKMFYTHVIPLHAIVAIENGYCLLQCLVSKQSGSPLRTDRHIISQVLTAVIICIVSLAE